MAVRASIGIPRTTPHRHHLTREQLGDRVSQQVNAWRNQAVSKVGLEWQHLEINSIGAPSKNELLARVAAQAMLPADARERLINQMGATSESLFEVWLGDRSGPQGQDVAAVAFADPRTGDISALVVYFRGRR